MPKTIRLIETCLPRSYIGKSDNGEVFHKIKEETLDQFRWRIMAELDSGCIFLFE